MDKSVIQLILKHSQALSDWFLAKAGNSAYPIYSSYDIRDSGYKITAVDANIYPAGFNNICKTDKSKAAARFARYITHHFEGDRSRIMLVTEKHTKNPFYWDNVAAIKGHLESSGRKVLLAIPQRLDSPLDVVNSKGDHFEVHSGFLDNLAVKEFAPQLVISNNDFSETAEDWIHQITQPVIPPYEMGWYQRKKSLYFSIYNQLCEEFAQLVGIDPFPLTVQTEHFQNFDITDTERKKELAARIDNMLIKLQKDYSERGIQQKPFVFVKNNSGTYGLAVIRVGGGEEVLNWSYNSRKKMKAAKGGSDVEEVIIQEGIPSIVKTEGVTAEPVVYMVGCEVAGGFLRTHQEKNETESLNSPGAVYKTYCFSNCEDPTKEIEEPQVRAYSWIARLGLLAIAEESRQMGVKYKDFLPHRCVSRL